VALLVIIAHLSFIGRHGVIAVGVEGRLLDFVEGRAGKTRLLLGSLLESEYFAVLVALGRQFVAAVGLGLDDASTDQRGRPLVLVEAA